MAKRVKTKKYPSGWGYQIDVRITGQKRQRPTFPTQALANQAEIQLKSDAIKRNVGLPIESKVTMQDLVDAHLEAIKKRRPKTARVKTILNRFIEVVGMNAKPASIKTAHFNDYAKIRKSLKPQSINREFHEITACLNASGIYFASLEGYHCPRPPYQEEPDLQPPRLWTDEEVGRVLAKLYEPQRPSEQAWKVRTRHDVADLFILALNTGLRAGEVVKIKKSDVDFTNEIIHVTSLKGKRGLTKGRKREVPLNDEATRIIRKRLEVVGDSSHLLFPGRSGQCPLSNPQKAFRTACLDAGLDYGSLLFKFTRSTYENRLLDDGYRIDLVGEIMGHSEQTMLKHYTRVSREQKLRAVKSTKMPGQTLDTNAAKAVKVVEVADEQNIAKAQ
jgi:integrase